MYDLFFITDGTDYVNLRSRYEGFFLAGWNPSIVEPKGGGVWQESPLADGRRLVDRPLANAVEKLALVVGSGGQDATIRDTQIMRRLLEKAVNFSLTDWQTEPVYIMCRARQESNIRYALILDYRAPGENNPFADPFDAEYPLITNFPLILERGDWTDNPPGQPTCIQLSTAGSKNGNTTEVPTNNSDTAAYYLPLDVISVGGANMNFGEDYEAGIRFTGVAVPQGATIISAVITGVATDVHKDITAKARISGEAADSASTFSTEADFTGRVRTSAAVDWNGIETMITGLSYDTPELKTIVQEIVNRSGWVKGQNMAFFIRDNGSTYEDGPSGVCERNWAGLAHATLDPPSILIVYKDATQGQEATCYRYPIIGNKGNRAPLTAVFHYDTGSATYSANLLGSALPYEIMPTGPTVDDLAYFFADGPFASLVLDLQYGLDSGVTAGVWEYYNNGGAWVTLTTTDYTALSGDGLKIIGQGSIHWNQPSDWASVTVNGVTGYGVRFRVTAGTSAFSPTVQNRQPYTIIWDFARIDRDQLGGDLPPLVTWMLYNRSDDTYGAGPEIRADRIILGTRLEDRGEEFNPFLNTGSVQIPYGITLTLGTNTQDTTDPRSPTGKVARYRPAGVESSAIRLRIKMSEVISNEYKGTFKPYLRVYQSGSSVNRFEVILKMAVYNAANFVYTSDIVYVTSTNYGEVLEFPEITIPPALDTLKDGENIGDIFLSIFVAHNTTGSPTLNLIDLCLMPVDEWSQDTYTLYPAGDGGLSNANNQNKVLEIDSARRIRRPYTATLLLESNERPRINWLINANSPIGLQPKGDQRLFMFSMKNESGVWVSNIAHAVGIQAYQQKRYFSMRGNQ